MNRRLATVLLAVILGLVGTGAVLWYVRTADQRAAAGKNPVVVLVAAKTIPAGEPVSALLSGGYVKNQTFPGVSVPSDAVKAIGDVPSDGVLRDSVLPGQVLRSSLVVPKGDSTAFTIPQGKIALTVQLSDPARVAGYLKVGSKAVAFASGHLIDSKGTRKGDATGVRLLAKDLEVLAVGTDSGSSGNNANNLVTVAVSQQDAEKLIMFTGGNNQDGGLYLGLEGDSSNLSDTDPGVTSFTVFGGSGG